MTSISDPLPQDTARIRRKRIEAGLSQPALAERAGFHKSTIYRIEEGLIAPLPSTLQRLAEALGCEIADLLPPKTAKARS